MLRVPLTLILQPRGPSLSPLHPSLKDGASRVTGSNRAHNVGGSVSEVLPEGMWALFRTKPAHRGARSMTDAACRRDRTSLGAGCAPPVATMPRPGTPVTRWQESHRGAIQAPIPGVRRRDPEWQQAATEGSERGAGHAGSAGEDRGRAEEAWLRRQLPEVTTSVSTQRMETVWLLKVTRGKVKAEPELGSPRWARLDQQGGRGSARRPAAASGPSEQGPTSVSPENSRAVCFLSVTPGHRRRAAAQTWVTRPPAEDPGGERRLLPLVPWEEPENPQEGPPVRAGSEGPSARPSPADRLLQRPLAGLALTLAAGFRASGHII